MIKANTEDEYLIKIPKTFKNYKIIEYIDCGSTSVVFLVEDQKTKENFSAKIMSKSDISNRNLLKSVMNEVKVLQSIDHPNIIKIKEFFELSNYEKEEFYVIIMEYCVNGDLLSYASNKGFTNEAEKKKIINGFIRATKYLHNHGISHGDIKSENILLDENLSPKLCDFGYCRLSTTAGNDCKNGTLFYGAPELFVEGEFDTLKTDIYAIGITLYSITELQFPYRDGDQKLIIKQIMSNNLSFRDGMDLQLRNLVEKCTLFDPKLRPSIDDILNDEYLKFNEEDIIKNNNCTQKAFNENSKINNSDDSYINSYEALPI